MVVSDAAATLTAAQFAANSGSDGDDDSAEVLRGITARCGLSVDDLTFVT